MQTAVSSLNDPLLTREECVGHEAKILGSGCGSVGSEVASDTRDPRFESSHRQTFIEHLFSVNCVEKTKIKKKEAKNGPFFKVKA